MRYALLYRMRDVTESNFGLLIAYLIPGFTALLGASFFSPVVASWLGASTAGAPTLGGFLYVTIASVALGLTVSTIRWLLVDSIHHHTGIPEPHRRFGRLQEKLGAYQYLVSTHYHYYQFYSNMLLALAFSFTAYACRRPDVSAWAITGLVGVELVFWLGSRDTLRKYYAQASTLLNKPERGA